MLDDLESVCSGLKLASDMVLFILLQKMVLRFIGPDEILNCYITKKQISV